MTLPNFLNMEFMDPDVPWRDEIISRTATGPRRTPNRQRQAGLGR
ncbi:MAG: hypothetical protein OXC83_00800 [Chloroflexi bacterium]|nr:hypothetical protein [Chloroflexota bacterium]